MEPALANSGAAASVRMPGVTYIAFLTKLRRELSNIHVLHPGHPTANSGAAEEIEFLEPGERCGHVAVRGLECDIETFRQYSRNLSG